MEWVMCCALVPARVVPMGLWVVWWRAATLGMGEGVLWGCNVEEMFMMMMVVEISLWMEWMLETYRGVVVGEAMVVVWGIWWERLLCMWYFLSDWGLE